MFILKKGYKLKEEDVFKIGRATFKIKSIFIKKTKIPKVNITEENYNKSMGQDNSGFLLKPTNKFNLETDNNKRIDKTFIKETLKKQQENDILVINRFDKSRTNYICRVCLSEENDVELNPLIHPCNCSGTMRYIHLKCLKSWFKAKINIKVFNNLTLYNFKDLHCELCNATIPGKVNR